MIDNLKALIAAGYAQLPALRNGRFTHGADSAKLADALEGFIRVAEEYVEATAHTDKAAAISPAKLNSSNDD